MSLSSSAPTTGVQLVDSAKSFGTVRAVQGVDISVAPGETVALLGPNGAGKSTTIDMMLGLTRPDRGHVELFGMTPADAIKTGAGGVMLQSGALIRDLSVRELITMVGSIYPDPLGVDEVLVIGGLCDVAERRDPTNMHRHRSRRGRCGLRQRARSDRSDQTPRRAHFDMTSISVLGKGMEEERHVVGFDTAGRRTGRWATWGGLWGWIFGVLIVIPGVGHIAIGGYRLTVLLSTGSARPAVRSVGRCGASGSRRRCPYLRSRPARRQTPADRPRERHRR